jgi:hypothetical protein
VATFGYSRISSSTYKCAFEPSLMLAGANSLKSVSDHRMLHSLQQTVLPERDQ